MQRCRNVEANGGELRLLNLLLCKPAGKPREQPAPPSSSPPAAHAPCPKGHAGNAGLTESAVILPGAMHRAVGEDFQVEARAAVELPPPQDAFKVGKVRGRPPLQPSFNLSQSLVQKPRRIS